MAHSKSYSVNSKVCLPQPHVEYASARPATQHSWSSWFLFALLGVGAVTLIVCLNMLGGQWLFMQAVDPTAGLVPIVYRGELEVFPHFEGSNNGIESRFVMYLPSNNLTATSDSLSKLLDRYPEDHGTVYTNCWLENPNPEKPCFFDTTWVTDLCTSEYGYGYEERDEHYSPCFLMKLEGTKNWIPRLNENLPDHHDYGFVPVHCFLENSRESNASISMSVFPSKGFSRLFFPASKFDNRTYLPPLVAVKLDGIRRGDIVTVRCSVITPNAFILKNNGRVVVTFSAD